MKKPTERALEIAAERLRSGCPECEAFLAVNGASLTLESLGEALDEQAELASRRFEFLVEAIESGDWTALRERAREAGLL
jgi:hypothetical protein